MTPVADPLSPDNWPDSLRRAFEKLPPHASWIVALSGGLDSVLLLNLCWHWRRARGQSAPLTAIHVNHGLQAEADTWAAHCRTCCARLGIPLAVHTVIVESRVGRGLEDAAREARYGTFERNVATGQVLLLAHHADDQAETLLYRLMRGAGLTGFSGMPEQRALGQGRLMRPLLSQTRQQLMERARAAGLEWNEDPSNSDERYDRNFVRRRVMPLLRSRWPAVSERLAQNSVHGREALQILDERAEDDAVKAVDPVSGDLLLSALLALSGPRQRNLVQWWLRKRGLAPLSEKHLLKALPDFLGAREDAHPRIDWQGLALRRFGDRVCVLNLASLAGRPADMTWRLTENLTWAGGMLCASGCYGEGLATPNIALCVRARRGGERLTLTTGQHQPLKTWLQARHMPLWERAALPLLWSGDTLVAIGDLWIHPDYRAQPGQPGWRLRWSPPDFRAREVRNPTLDTNHSD